MTLRRRLGRVFAFALLTFGSAAGIDAQVIVGQVLEEGSLHPLAGAFVLLEDEEGRRGDGVLTGADGRFRLRGIAGRYRLLVETLGYASARTEFLDLREGGTVEQRIEVPVEALSLEGIRVEGRRRCSRRPAEAEATARLWDEARKALEVARWSMREGVLRFHLTEYEREVDARSLAVRSQTTRPRNVQRNASPYRSLPAERLARDGYVIEAADGTYGYYLPDAEVLLSDPFLDTHCFSVAEAPRDEPDLVGLAFEPVPERTLPDVEGVLWLDRATAELRRLEVTYTNLPPTEGRGPEVGGRVEFERLSNGMWVVRRWRIRMPLTLAEVRRNAFSDLQLELVSLLEQGAEVRSIRTPSGALLSESIGGTLHGTATDAQGRPLSGATVEIGALGQRTTTRADGTYRISGLPAGAYDVSLAHPDFGLLGLEPLLETVEVTEGRPARLAFHVPTSPARATALCSEWGAAAGDVLVYGRVLAADSAPVPGGILRLRTGAAERRIAADSAGSFRICLPAGGVPVQVAAVADAGVLAPFESLAATTVPADARGFFRADLPLRVPAPGSVGADRRGWSNAVVGRVLDAATAVPIAGVSLVLRDREGKIAAAAVSDSAGRFRLRHPPGDADRFTLTAEHIAYGAVAGEIAFGRADEVRLDVQLTTRPLELEPIVVRERRRGALADVGYYERRDAGMGMAMDRAEIERRVPSRVTDLFSGTTGFKVVPLDRSGTIWDVRVSGAVGLRSTGTERDCEPSVWLDGTLVRPGGPPSFDPLMGRYVGVPLSEVVNPGAIEAIESFSHPAEVPPRFGGSTAACGVILIWTRQHQPGGG